MFVIKRNGEKESISIDKIHKVLEHACEGISGVSTSDIEIKAKLIFYDGIKTADIQQTLIQAATQLIHTNYNYQYVAGRLINYDLYKKIYRGPIPHSLETQITRGIERGFYNSDLKKWYSASDIMFLDKHILHERDMQLTVCSMSQLAEKYLLKDKKSKKPYETPNMAFMLIAMTVMAHMPKISRLAWVIDYYNEISSQRLSLPTPLMARCRTNQTQYSSCTVIDCGDSIDSIKATTNACLDYVSNLAGLGVNVGRMRAVGSPINNGLKVHTGLTGFIKLFEAAINSCNSGGVRKGSGTINFMLWHYEVVDLIVLKNDEGSIDNRARGLDYCVHLHKMFLQRYLDDKHITLFSPNDVPGLYEAYYDKDPSNFIKLYEQYENDPSIRKTKIGAKDLIHRCLEERSKTHRLYFMWADNVNKHSTFEEYICCTNLCVEITLPTKPVSTHNPKPSIALCTLSAINIGVMQDKFNLKITCERAVYGLNEVLNNQYYPVKDAELHTKYYRPLGIGIINLAYFHAKNHVKYGDPRALELVDEWMEAFAYYLINASIDYARDTGIVAQGTLFNKGILPIDTYERNVDELVKPNLRFDWETTRERLLKYGIANGSLMAQMPAETSAQISNSTNGPEQIIKLVTNKKSGSVFVPQVAPQAEELADYYDYRDSHAQPTGYLKTIAVMQKWFCQSISANTSYNKFLFPILPGEENHKVPMSAMVDDLLFSTRYGIKTWYYRNSVDGNAKENVQAHLLESKKESDVCEACSL